MPGELHRLRAEATALRDELAALRPENEALRAEVSHLRGTTTVYNATSFAGAPKWGTPVLRVMANDAHLPDPAAVRDTFAEAKAIGGAVYYNAEVQGPQSDYVAFFATLCDMAEAADPAVPYTIYGLGGHWGYWPLQSPQHLGWYEQDMTTLGPVLRRLTFLSPDLYSRSGAISAWPGWLANAGHMIASLKRFGRPIRPFLMPFVQDVATEYLDTPHDPATWRLMLGTVLPLCNGAVIWGGPTARSGKYEPQAWDEDAVWWGEVKRTTGI